LKILFVLKQIDYVPQGILHLSSTLKLHLSSTLKAAGHEVALTVASLEDPVRFAVEFAPDILAYSVTMLGPFSAAHTPPSSPR